MHICLEVVWLSRHGTIIHMVFLCFTFGSDKAEHWSDIRPVIGGYQSRFLCRYDGEFELTDLGKYLRDEEEAEAGRESDSAEKVDVFA